MWQLQYNGENLNIVLQDFEVLSEGDILGQLETQLDTEHPDLFPYGCYDVEVLDRSDSYIEIKVDLEDDDSTILELFKL